MEKDYKLVSIHGILTSFNVYMKLTVMNVADKSIAFAGILKYGCTYAQCFENGRAPSRETAQSVRDEVVPVAHISKIGKGS